MTTSRSTRAWLAAALFTAAVAHGCARPVDVRRFPLTTAMWIDRGDFRRFEPMPEARESSWIWDGADQLVFRKASEAFRFERPREATNVNAMDEVPSSSWYENRASLGPLSIDALLRGACGDRAPLDPRGPWTVTGGKPGGANPGFMIEDAEGRRFLLKFDSRQQPERTTTAEVVGSMLYWAAGFRVPCNRIVPVDPSVLAIGEGATATVRGREVPFEPEMLAEVFRRATPLPDGRYRAVASAILDGEPLGPWTYDGTADDDPNDVVPHEHRRELRGSALLAAWILHYDTREQNTLAMWIEREGGGFVRHHLIDFGDSLGSIWRADGISRRIGHASYFDVPQVTADFFTLGTVRRPWHHSRFGPAGASLGYFNVEDFDPDEWKPGYPNPAFDRATERDHAWMARIIANIPEDHVRAVVREAKVGNPVMHDELESILLGRRAKLLARYLTRVSPLTRPSLEVGPRGARVCLRDLGVATGVAGPWSERPYWTRSYAHLGGARLVALPRGALARRRPDEVCVDLPDVRGASPSAPAYVLVDVGALEGEGDRTAPPLRMHLYQLGRGRYRLAGLERPSTPAPPNARR